MSSFLIWQGARHTWGGERDKEGHRIFKLKSRIKTTSQHDGPATVMSTPGLPAVGSPWNFGNDNDFWAFCYPEMKVESMLKGKPNFDWLVTQTFGTRPLNRCQDASIEDPLLEPQKLSGSFVTEQKAATKDRNGVLIASSSHEIVKGPLNEWDNALPTVRVEQNVANLGLPLFTSMMNTVNDAPLWGMPARTIKLSGSPWQEKYWGLCNKYYTRTFNFDVNEDTFDRDDIMDEGTKVLRGAWDNATPPVWVVDAGPPAADKTKADQFIRAVDPSGNSMRVILDGNGVPLVDSLNPVTIPMGTVERYEESNFLLLGIPVNIG